MVKIGAGTRAQPGQDSPQLVTVTSQRHGGNRQIRKPSIHCHGHKMLSHFKRPGNIGISMGDEGFPHRSYAEVYQGSSFVTHDQEEPGTNNLERGPHLVERRW